MKKYKLVSFLLVAIFCMNIILPVILSSTTVLAIETTNTIYINSAEDLISLAKKCSLDIWSQEKTVILNNNIDLSGVKFISIPTFGGIFDGQGYTISGLSLTDYGSPQGLFCYVQEEALIKKLTVKGVVTPIGTKSIIGGVAGNNNGTIQNCIFNGVIRGDKYIGGIAGINQAKGLISNCSVQGIAYGEHNVGGIAGENLGTILLSTNEANINTTVEESSFNLENINSINVENLTSFSTADIVDISDIGGIAGFSSGIIQSCSNIGTVGYRNVGYNIGGIVGRQSGYVNGCKNDGVIYGRKDVGGIAGQIEPYAFWELSENSLGKLRKELNTLQSLINVTINNTDQYSSAISTQLAAVGKHISDTRTAGDVLVDQTISLLNDNIDNINNVSARITQTLVAMEPIMGSFSAAIGDMKMAIGRFKTAMEQLEVTTRSAKFGMNRLNPALDKLDAALGTTKKALDNISNSLTSLKAGMGDPKAVKDALSDMQKGITSLIDGMVQIADGARALYDAADTLQNSEVWQDNSTTIKNGANELIIGAGKMNDAMQAISNALILLEGDFDKEKLSAALTSLESALANFASATEKLYSGFSKISSGFETGLEQIIHAYKGSEETQYTDSEETQREWYREIAEGVQEIASSMEDIQKSVRDLQDMLNYLQETN
ncbi:MAG TPA: hypothetical protein PK733_10310, partial [Clostridiales bacterium]|nr:hypothetical protein [Clostridiales bacterium]